MDWKRCQEPFRANPHRALQLFNYSIASLSSLEARLRRRLTPKEASIAVAALLRRDEMEPSARVALFSEMAEHFKSVQPFPEEALFGLSDEQVVREMVNSLFADGAA